MKHPKFVTTPEISKRMSQVKLKRGVAEKALAKALWNCGVRYRCNYRALPGSPDIAITKHKVAVFVDGEFWHGYDWENRKARLKSNREYWIEKIEENIARDERNNAMLESAEWIVMRFWEKDILKHLDSCVDAVLSTISIRNGTNRLQYENVSDHEDLLMVAEPADYQKTVKNGCRHDD